MTAWREVLTKGDHGRSMYVAKAAPSEDLSIGIIISIIIHHHSFIHIIMVTVIIIIIISVIDIDITTSYGAILTQAAIWAPRTGLPLRTPPSSLVTMCI